MPEPAQILLELHGRDLLQGEIIDVSDGGLEPGAFVVVKVEGLGQPLIVPATQIQRDFCA